MSRGLSAAAVVAVVLVVAGCGGHKTAQPPAKTVPAAKPTASFVVYGKPQRAQFVNHADDRERGDKATAFNADVLPTPPSANSGKKGARAGDNGLFSLTLYSDRGLTHQIGSATYSCTFNFAQEAVCDGQFSLGSGTIIALGPAKLDGGQIVLAVTGGTGQYAGAHGQVASNSLSTTKATQTFRFTLV